MNSKFEKAEAIIFDLDGTLWDSCSQLTDGWNHVLSRYPDLRKPATVEELRGYMGKTGEEIAGLMLPDQPIEVAGKIMKECEAAEVQWISEHGGCLFEGLRAVMEQLKKRYKLYIVSNCQDGYVQAFLKYHALADLFGDYEMSGRTGRPKSENIRMVMERNLIREAVYVGDTESDRQAARAAGTNFIHAAYGFGTVQEADAVIETLTGLAEELLS